MRQPRHKLHYLLCAVVGLLAASCASIGRPNGGAYDYDPPVLVKSNPTIGERNVTRNKIVLEFDENIQVQDVSTKVVVSPAQKSTPAITGNGHKVTVELRDTLLANTTYTIDFSDAIKDYNEGNVLDGLSMEFSTGDDLDSLRISGMVFEARTLEPAQGMLVGVYSNLSDTAVTTLQMERIAKTNQYGQFTIRGMKPGVYNVFAINDINRDYHWDRSEDIAFYPTTVSPIAVDTVVTDSLRTPLGADSLVVRKATQYLPNDILLTWFNENYVAQYIQDYKRPERHYLTLTMGAPSDSLPTLRPVGGALNGKPHTEWSLIQRNQRADSLEYYLTDSTLILNDSLKLAVTTYRPDNDDVWKWQTDTLNFYFKAPKEDKKKKDDDEANDSIPKINFLSVSIKSGSDQDLYGPITLQFDQPLKSVDPKAFHMEIKRDSVWLPIDTPVMYRADTLNLKNYKIDYTWEAGLRYKLSIDSAAIYGIYGLWNKPKQHEFTVRQADEYSALYMSISGLEADEHAIVELLKGGDKVSDTASVVNGTAAFPHIAPGEYYARLFIDRNNNSEWDTGSIADSIQPEEVYYYPKKLNLKKNWDVEQAWDLYATPVDKQKPNAIKKNKPKDNKVRRRNPDGSYVDDDNNRNSDGYDDEDDEENSFYGPGYGNGSRNIGTSNSRFGNSLSNRNY